MTAGQTQEAIRLFIALGNMLGAGVPVLQALEGARADTKDRTLKAELKQVIDTIAGKKSPDEAWRFLPVSAQLIWKAGLVGGNLDDCCLRIAEILEA